MSGVYALMDTLLPFEGLHYTFMKNALIAILLLTPLFGMLGTKAVDKKMALFSDALGHSALTGIAIGVVLGWQSQMSAMLLFGLIRNLRALKDEKKLKQQYVKEGDERQKQIYTNALCAAMRATLILGLAAVIVAGYFSMTVSLTLLVTVLLGSLMTLAFKLYFGKKY